MSKCYIEISKSIEDELELQNDEFQKTIESLKKRNNELCNDNDHLKVFANI